MKSGMDGASGRFPSAIVEVRDGQPEFEFESVFGVKVAAGIAAHDFELSVDSLDDIGGGEGPSDGFGIFEEGEIVGTFLAEHGDPGRVIIGKAVTEIFESAGTDVLAPGGLDRAPALLKLGGVGFGAVDFGLAPHGNHRL